VSLTRLSASARFLQESCKGGPSGTPQNSEVSGTAEAVLYQILNDEIFCPELAFPTPLSINPNDVHGFLPDIPVFPVSETACRLTLPQTKLPSKTSNHDQTGTAGETMLRKPTAGHYGFCLLTSPSVSLTHTSEVPLHSGRSLLSLNPNVPESRDFEKLYLVTQADFFASNAKFRLN
jgi:hypothetical protein